MTAAHYKGGHHPGNDLGLHYTALPPILGSCPYSDQLLVTRKFWSPGANRPSQARADQIRFSAWSWAGFIFATPEYDASKEGCSSRHSHSKSHKYFGHAAKDCAKRNRKGSDTHL